MKSKSLFENHIFFYTFIGITAVGLIYFTVNIFVIGGDLFVLELNQYFPPVFSVFAAALSVQIWRSTSAREISRKIWGYFSAGVVLWALAEITWAIYTLVLNEEVPYPSLADIFWVIGYVMLGVALYLRYQTLQAKPSQRQFRILAVGTGIFTLVSLYLVLPSVLEDISEALAQGFTISSFVESALNILYPAGDLILLVMSVFIFFALQSGEYSLPWRFIAVGLTLSSLSDLIFIYATSQGLYYPNGQVTLLTGLSDAANGMSYAIMSLGLLAYHFISVEKRSTKVEFHAEEVINSYILLFTNEKNELISCSDNFLQLTNLPAGEKIEGKLLHNVLATDEKTLENIIKRIVVRGYINDYPLTINDTNGKPLTLWISALSTQDSNGRFSGANIVLRTHAALKNKPISSESQAMIQHVLTKTGAQDKINREQAIAYFKAQINTLQQLVIQLGGAGVARKMIDLVNESARKNGWEILGNENGFSIPEDYDLKTLAEAIQVLLTEAQAYAVDIAGEQAVTTEMDKTESMLDVSTRRLAEAYKLRGL